MRIVRRKSADSTSAVTIALHGPGVFSSTKSKSNRKSYLVMKPIIPFALLGALLAVGAADAAATDPVGYITHTVAGTGGSGTALTVLAPTLIQPTVYAGVSSASPSTLTVVTLPTGVPATLDSTYVLEITSGPSEGWWSTVMSSTATSITVNDAFPAGLPADTEISVRKHNTLQTFLGENTPGIAPFNGTTGDEVQILTPAQSIISIVYVPAAVSGAPEDDWFNLVTLAPENDRVIEPGSAILVKTSSATDLTFTSSGDVKITKTQVDVFPNLTLIGQVDAVGATLGEMNLATQLIQLTGSNTDFDEFQFLSAGQAITSNVALAPGVAGPNASMADLVSTGPSDNLLFPEGTGAILKRNPGNAASVITIPGSTVTP